jgi:hypothetical protein
MQIFHFAVALYAKYLQAESQNIAGSSNLNLPILAYKSASTGVIWILQLILTAAATGWFWRYSRSRI